MFRRAPRILVQPLEAAQAPECARIHAGAFAHPWSAEDLEAMISSTSTVADAALDAREDALAGFVISRVASGEAEILTIAVATSLRRSGFGSVLLDMHLARLASQRVRELFLEVDEGNGAARALYQRAGFAIVGRRDGYYRKADGSRASALVMRKALI